MFLDYCTTFIVEHPLLAAYFIGITLATFFMFGLDKLYASSGSRRISERTLLLLSLAGGSVGALVATAVFRHKRRKDSFMVPLILILIVHGLLLWLLLRSSFVN